MKKLFGRFGVFILMASALTACQTVDLARVKVAQMNEQTGTNAFITCTGTEICEFERLNDVQIMDEKTKRVHRQALNQGILRAKVLGLNEATSLYLSVPASEQHELVIRFYPISKDRAEKLHVIQAFNPNKNYTFKMYRQRSTAQGSLLNVSAPDPLCVDLLMEQKSIRRFCKPYDALTGLGEFVEQKI